MKFRKMLFLALVIFSLVPLYIVSMFLTYTQSKNTQTIITENLETISKIQIQEITDFCDERQQNMEMLASYTLIKDSILNSMGEKELEDPESRTYLKDILIERISYKPYIRSLSLLDRDFNVVMSTEDYTLGERSEFADIKTIRREGTFHMSNVYERTTEEGVEHLVLAYMGIFDDDKLIGYMVEELTVRHLKTLGLDTSVGKDGTVYISDGNNVTISTNFADDEHVDMEAESLEGAEAYLDKWQSIDFEKKPVGTFEYMKGDEQYIIYYSTIPNSEWTIRVDTNYSDYASRTHFSYKVLLQILLITTVIMIGFFIYLSRRLVKPMEKIRDVLERVQKDGDYTLRIENKKTDEFGILSTEIDNLLAYVEAVDKKGAALNELLSDKVKRDPLTGAYNKSTIDICVDDKLAEAQRKDVDIIVGFLDIDDFRDFNTKYGHQKGDQVIRFVAEAMRECIGDGVGRNGGDEFLFWMANAWERQEIKHDLDLLLKRLNEGISLDGSEEKISVACSIGVVEAKANTVTRHQLISMADEAMYEAKHRGKNQYYYIEL